VDEIHRFNKAQQDAFLPFVENGTIVLLGSTTENPFFEINSPLVSRCRLYTFEPLSSDQIRTILLRALQDEERGFGRPARLPVPARGQAGQGPGMRLKLDDDALAHMANMSEGDARVGLNALETAALLVGEGGHITLAVAEQALQRRAIEYDKDADSHYDTISAFIKSLRGSDPDAALHYLARMLKAGEDARFIARRLVVHASEDVGNADPMALVVATSAAHAVEYVGLPEARLALAQAAIYIATAPKSNATYAALDRAMEDVEKRGAQPVPKHLRDPHYPGAARLGHGEGYQYPHSFPGAFVPQEYMPADAESGPYYEPSERGYEAEIRRRMQEWKAASQREQAQAREAPDKPAKGKSQPKCGE
jgi:putative ATPase